MHSRLSDRKGPRRRAARNGHDPSKTWSVDVCLTLKMCVNTGMI